MAIWPTGRAQNKTWLTARMADKPTKEEPQGDEAPKKAGLKSKLTLKTLIIAGVGLLVFGGGGYGAYAFLGKHHEEKPVVAKAKPAVFFDVPEVLVNLNGGERTQYLKIKMVLEVPDQEVIAQIQPVMPRVLDTFQTYLRELRPADLEGSAGLYRLREELTRRVNAAIAPTHVSAVLFKEIVVQ